MRAAIFFLTLGFYNILALFTHLTSAFAQPLCEVFTLLNFKEKKIMLHFALLEFSQFIVIVLCAAVFILLWQEEWAY